MSYLISNLTISPSWFRFHGTGATAGGCANNRETHKNNPIYQLQLSSNASVLIELRGPKEYRYSFGASASEGLFLVRDNRVFKGPFGRSLRLFACATYSAHSAHSLCSAALCYTPFMGLLTHFAHSHGTIEILNNVFTL